MLLDTANYQFWIVGLLWFTVPILSWLWSLTAIKRFKDLNSIVPDVSKQLKETTEVLEATKKIYELACNERMETLTLKLRAEDEVKAARGYYKKIEDLLKT